MAAQQQHCVRCGKSNKQVEFRSPLALKCVGCDDDTILERKEYHRVYHKARGRALKRLIDLHPRQFEKLLNEERISVEAEEAGEPISASG